VEARNLGPAGPRWRNAGHDRLKVRSRLAQDLTLERHPELYGTGRM
jgi:hypothetical protein